MSSLQIAPILIHIQADYPFIKFREGPDFMWDAKKSVVYVNSELLTDPLEVHYLLHEVGHAILKHDEYGLDVDLLRLEAEAWNEVPKLAERHHVTFKEEYADDALRSYKEWLHARSTCPQCGRLGLQRNKSTYNCFNCGCSWKVPTSRSCMIRRYIVHE